MFLPKQVTRLIPEARGTKCNQELESINGTKHSNILRVPFSIENKVLRQWVSRFDVYPYLEKFTQACFELSDNSFIFWGFLSLLNALVCFYIRML
jgi:hypothetical protein